MRNDPEIRTCPTCGNFFNYTGVRDNCVECAQKEEKIFDEVYRFLRRRENRAASVERIVEETGVEEELLYKWVRRGRLQPAHFPNLGYPCDKCGKLTTSGKLCEPCQSALQKDLNQFEAAKEFRESIKESEERAYFTKRE